MQKHHFQTRTTPHRRLVTFLFSAAILAVSQIGVRGVTIQIDYTYDTNSFFGTAQRTVIETAASYLGGLIVDDLEAIAPANPGPFGLNSWTASFKNPSDVTQTLSDNFLTVPVDTVIVYAGGSNFSGPTLAEAGFGDAVSFGSAAWNTTVATRGESGTPSNDIGPWGGYLSVDTSGTSWDLSIDGSTMTAADHHLYSVLLHELAHVLGLGTAPSWDTRVSGTNFIGTEATSVYGSAVPLRSTASPFTDDDHFLDGISSNIYGTGTPQEPAMAADITANQVKLFTELDVAALDDIGWDIASPAIPEPGSVALVVICLSLIALRRRR